MLSRERLLRALLIGVGPIENLLFDELASLYLAEWRAGEVQISPSCNRQEVYFRFQQLLQIRRLFVDLFDFLFCGCLQQSFRPGNRLLFALEQLFR